MTSVSSNNTKQHEVPSSASISPHILGTLNNDALHELEDAAFFLLEDEEEEVIVGGVESTTADASSTNVYTTPYTSAIDDTLLMNAVHMEVQENAKVSTLSEAVNRSNSASLLKEPFYVRLLNREISNSLSYQNKDSLSSGVPPSEDNTLVEGFKLAEMFLHSNDRKSAALAYSNVENSFQPKPEIAAAYDSSSSSSKLLKLDGVSTASSLTRNLYFNIRKDTAQKPPSKRPGQASLPAAAETKTDDSSQNIPNPLQTAATNLKEVSHSNHFKELSLPSRDSASGGENEYALATAAALASVQNLLSSPWYKSTSSTSTGNTTSPVPSDVQEVEVNNPTKWSDVMKDPDTKNVTKMITTSTVTKDPSLYQKETEAKKEIMKDNVIIIDEINQKNSVVADKKCTNPAVTVAPTATASAITTSISNIQPQISKDTIVLENKSCSQATAYSATSSLTNINTEPQTHTVNKDENTSIETKQANVDNSSKKSALVQQPTVTHPQDLINNLFNSPTTILTSLYNAHNSPPTHTLSATNVQNTSPVNHQKLLPATIATTTAAPPSSTVPTQPQQNHNQIPHAQSTGLASPLPPPTVIIATNAATVPPSVAPTQPQQNHNQVLSPISTGLANPPQRSPTTIATYTATVPPSVAPTQPQQSQNQVLSPLSTGLANPLPPPVPSSIVPTQTQQIKNQVIHVKSNGIVNPLQLPDVAMATNTAVPPSSTVTIQPQQNINQVPSVPKPPAATIATNTAAPPYSTVPAQQQQTMNQVMPVKTNGLVNPLQAPAVTMATNIDASPSSTVPVQPQQIKNQVIAPQSIGIANSPATIANTAPVPPSVALTQPQQINNHIPPPFPAPVPTPPYYHNPYTSSYPTAPVPGGQFPPPSPVPHHPFMIMPTSILEASRRQNQFGFGNHVVPSVPPPPMKYRRPPSPHHVAAPPPSLMPPPPYAPSHHVVQPPNSHPYHHMSLMPPPPSHTSKQGTVTKTTTTTTTIMDTTSACINNNVAYERKKQRAKDGRVKFNDAVETLAITISLAGDQSKKRATCNDLFAKGTFLKETLDTMMECSSLASSAKKYDRPSFVGTAAILIQAMNAQCEALAKEVATLKGKLPSDVNVSSEENNSLKRKSREDHLIQCDPALHQPNVISSTDINESPPKRNKIQEEETNNVSTTEIYDHFSSIINYGPVLQTISSFLDPRSLTRCNCVSKNWNAIQQFQDDVIWKQLCVKRFGLGHVQRWEEAEHSSGNSNTLSKMYAYQLMSSQNLKPFSTYEGPKSLGENCKAGVCVWASMTERSNSETLRSVLTTPIVENNDKQLPSTVSPTVRRPEYSTLPVVELRLIIQNVHHDKPIIIPKNQFFSVDGSTRRRSEEMLEVTASYPIDDRFMKSIHNLDGSPLISTPREELALTELRLFESAILSVYIYARGCPTSPRFQKKANFLKFIIIVNGVTVPVVVPFEIKTTDSSSLQSSTATSVKKMSHF